METPMREVPLWTKVESWVLDIALRAEVAYWVVPDGAQGTPEHRVVRRRPFEFNDVSFCRAGVYQMEPDPYPGILFGRPRRYGRHEEIVIRALEDGKWVPDLVLTDYKDKAWARGEINRRLRSTTTPHPRASPAR